jgi:hypothetical protein
MIALMGFIGEIFNKRFQFSSTIYTFLLANIGMGIGVMKGFSGRAPSAYKKEE